jgi:hypothetical protein
METQWTYQAYHIEVHRSAAAVAECLALFEQRYHCRPERLVCHRILVVPKDLDLPIERTDQEAMRQVIYLGRVDWDPTQLVAPVVTPAPVAPVVAVTPVAPVIAIAPVAPVAPVVAPVPVAPVTKPTPPRPIQPVRLPLPRVRFNDE